MSDTETGERRHETCRFGTLTEAYQYGTDLKTHFPLCTWKPSTPAPPAMSRAWGGMIDLARDCAVCQAHEPVTGDWQPTKGDK